MLSLDNYRWTTHGLLWLVSLPILIALLLLKISKLRAPSQLPAGPRPWPIFGNAVTIFKLHTDPERTLERLTSTYGSICTLWLGSWPMIVVNSADVAHELLQKRGASTSSRPTHSQFRTTIGRGRLVLTPAGPDFVKLRKIYHRLLNSDQTKNSRVTLLVESTTLLNELIQSPVSFYESVERYALSIIFTSTYGVRIDDIHSRVVVQLFKNWNVLLKYFQPGTALLPDTFPILLRLPRFLQPWYMLANRLIDEELQIHKGLLDRAQKLSDMGVAPDCYAGILRKWQKDEGADDRLVLGILAMIAGAGSDTTSSVLQNLFKVTALNRNALTTAQQEIDAVVGRDRLPIWEDEPNLPYTRALIKELHRWAPIGCLGIPHAANETITFDDLVIPKGTIIFPNLVSLNRDPVRYVDADRFEPLRFINDNIDSVAAANQSDFMKRDHFHYGFGRRLCLGVHMAEASLFIAISRIIWAFDINALAESPLDMRDKIYGLATKPKSFQVSVRLRDANAATVIQCEKQRLRQSFDDVQTI